MSLANQSGSAFRGDLNNALAAIASNNSSSTDPSTTFANQWYVDTGDDTLKIRNAANNAYVNVSAVGGIGTANLGLALAASPTFSGTATFSGNVLLSGTGTLDLPSGTTAQRPSSANNGMIRYNSTLSRYEGYSGSEWIRLGGDTTPAGTVIHTAASSAPDGYLKADGSAVSRTTYSDLFAAISTTYGSGNGSTTFNLPDLRGEFVRGLDDGRGVDTDRALGSAQSDQNKQHNHSVSDSGHDHDFDRTIIKDGGGITVGGQPAPGQGTHSMGTTNTGTSTETTGITIANDGGTETRPRNIALLACIKT
jgi:microcystin-dependent protein|tara:strand:- start:3188 stop:4111 length:924 start_codon:yes stop_codon:yes gene_type:complete